MSNKIYEMFAEGLLYKEDVQECFADKAWNPHPAYNGVCIKQLVAEAGEKKVRLLLVKVDPGCEMLAHVHENEMEIHQVIGGSGCFDNVGVKREYKPGMISVIPCNSMHAVKAGAEGLHILAIFV